MNLENTKRKGDSFENLNLSPGCYDFDEKSNGYLKEKNKTEFGVFNPKSKNKIALGPESSYDECFSSNNYATPYEDECPVNYSLKYSETESCKNLNKNEVTKKKYKDYTDYAETDLDQPTDFSLKYTEKSYEEENKNNSFKYYNNNKVKFKEYGDYVETDLDQPTDFTLKYRESAEEDVRNLEFNYYENETRSAQSSFDVHTVPEDTSSEQAPERFVSQNETPLMFSRSSSMNSLSSFVHITQSIPDDRSSIVSDFSRMTSGVISPSELPDSPTQTAPSSPKRHKPSVVFSTKSDFLTKQSVFEDDVATYKQEGTPIEFSRATSLSSLNNMDNSLKSELGIKRNASLVVSKEMNQDRAVDDIHPENLKQQMSPEKLEHEKGKFELASVLEVDESPFADCISIDIQINCCSLKPKASFNRPILLQENNPHLRQTVGFPMKPNFRLRFHNESKKGYSTYEGSDDAIHTYHTEGTPANVSCSGSHSDLSVLSITSGIPLSGTDDNSDNESFFPEHTESVPADKPQHNYLRKDHREMVTFGAENFSVRSPLSDLTVNVMDSPLNVNRTENCEEPPSQMLSPLRNVSPQSPNSMVFEESDEAEKCLEEQQNVYILSESVNQVNDDWDSTSKLKEKIEKNFLNKDMGCSELRTEPVNSTNFDFDSNQPLTPYEEALLNECIRLGMPKKKNQKQLSEIQYKLIGKDKVLEKRERDEFHFSGFTFDKTKYLSGKKTFLSTRISRTDTLNASKAVNIDFDSVEPLTPFEEVLLEQCIRLGMPQKKNCKKFRKAHLNFLDGGRCGRGSPCDQLCYELHDGMFECDCKDGYILHKNGYSCLEINTTAETYPKENEEDEDVLYQKDASISVELDTGEPVGTKTDVPTENKRFNNEIKSNLVTTLSPNLEQKVPSSRSTTQGVTESLKASETIPCTLDCGVGGVCSVDEGGPRCQCPLGRGGKTCEFDVSIPSPKFTGQGWLAFPALQAAYKHVQLEMEFRPESWDGILFLTGERDDMTGDFMSLLLNQGFLEFRFDCGSGLGVVRSEETVNLNEWNKLVLYRHRWDAWIQLNNGKHMQGRSKGLFSRITFREPVFIGGPGNTTGLSEKLPTEVGLKGCIRYLDINDHTYSFELSPNGDAIKGFDVVECTSDKCSEVPCQHSGKCLLSGEEAVCLCPLGFTGDLCQTRVDLQVPSFNGSSYLRYPGLGSSVLSWLDIQVTLKPSAEDGVILYNGHRTDGVGDFMAIYIHGGHLEFTFDLGTGAATIRMEKPIKMGQWHELRLSRTGRFAILQVDEQTPVHALAPGAFTQLSLPQNLYIGGVPNFDMVSPKVKVRTSFVGCIQKVVINDKPLHILAEALAGVNVANCPHPCVAQPCGAGKCIPILEYFTCECAEDYKDRECQEHEVPAMLDNIAIPRFTGSSYLHYSNPNIMKRIVSNQMKFNIRFKTNVGNGLILWTGDQSSEQRTDFLSLGLQDGELHFRFNLGGGDVDISYNESSLVDGNWHEVTASRTEKRGALTVDGRTPIVRIVPGKLTQLNTNTGLYVGGMENIEEDTLHKYTSGLVGCISRLVLDTDYDVKLMAMSTAGRNVQHCN